MNKRSLNPRIKTSRDYPYFRKTWNKVVIILLTSAFIPLLFIGGGLYYFAASALKTNTLNQLQFQVESYKQSIEQIFQTRIRELKIISQDISLLSTEDPQAALEHIFSKFQTIAGNSCFDGLRLIDSHGHDLAQVGANTDFNTDYNHSCWFAQVQDKGISISDAFQGNNKETCFILAVKFQSNPSLVLSGVICLDLFEDMVRDFVELGKTEMFLLNTQGILQFSWSEESLALPLAYLKKIKPFPGVHIEENQEKLVAFSWLKNVPWLCFVQEEKEVLFGSIKKVKIIGLLSFILGGILILFSVLLTTDYLVNRLEVKRKNIRLLDQKLLYMSRMASSMQLSYGFFRELKDVFVNIDMVVTLMQDSLQRNQTSNYNNDLTQIKSEIGRCQKAIDNFLGFTRAPGTSWMIREIQLNDLLSEFLAFMRNEFRLKNIVVYRELDEQLPIVRSNISRMRQAVQNLFLTVMNDMPEGGDVYLKTRSGENKVQISLTYPASDLDQDALENIIDPLWIDQVHGPGVWLALCIDHAEKLQANVKVSVEEDNYLSLSLVFPLRLR